MKYRAEIDGLRALAVIPVILFHAGFEYFNGGFIGVDVFFVISGYLITTILIEDIENKRFSLAEFYERRARRILPALFFVMLACLPFAWAWMLPSQMKDFSQSLLAVSFFISNILFWNKSGYFGPATEDMPLLHSWSLAIEEQYYVVFPIFLFLAWRFGKNGVFWLIVGFSIISLTLSECATRFAPSANFYLIPTRAWELLAGSITAFIIQKHGIRSNNTLSTIGFLAILCSIFIYDKTTPFPGLYALVPVLGVVLLIMFANADTYVARILSFKGFVGLGLISYSAYLWHQPLFAFAHIRLIDPPNTAVMLILATLSIGLAAISWKIVESPFRDKDRINRTALYSMISIFAIMFVTIGFLGSHFDKEYESYWLTQKSPTTRATYNVVVNQKRNFELDTKNYPSPPQCKFNVSRLNQAAEKNILECFNTHGKGVLIMGDSHATDLFGVVTSRFENPFIIGLTKGGCVPYAKIESCSYDAIIDFMKTHNQVFRKVIYEQSGSSLLQRSDGKKGAHLMFGKFGQTKRIENIVPDEKNIQKTLSFLETLSRHVQTVWFLPRAEPHISKNYILHSGCDAEYAYRPNQYEIFKNLEEAIISPLQKLNLNNITSISQNRLFQFNLETDFIDCQAFYWSDGNHFSESGEIRFGSRLPAGFIQ